METEQTRSEELPGTAVEEPVSLNQIYTARDLLEISLRAKLLQFEDAYNVKVDITIKRDWTNDEVVKRVEVEIKLRDARG